MSPHLNNMADTNQSPFSELSEYWLSVTRKDHYARGFGKWMLFTGEPHRLYQILREELLAGALREASSLKTKAKPPQGATAGEVYVFAGPYTDQESVLRVAEELREMNGVHQFRLVRPLTFKTDLHNTWCETLSRPGDGYYELLHEQNWLYKYQDGKLVINAVIQALHQVLEEPPENADPEFAIIRSMLPDELFAGD